MTKLEKMRISKNMTQQELGDLMGYSHSTISRVEAGSRAGSVAFWRAAGRALKTDWRELVTR